jgi:uncharacterized alkaline shock family protein YloU
VERKATNNRWGDCVGIIDRIALSLYSFALTIVSFFFLMAAFGWEAPVNLLMEALNSPSGRTTVGVLSGFLFLAGIRFVYYGFQRPPAQAVIHDTETGEVRISLLAIRSLVTRVAARVPGVREVKAKIWLNNQATAIQVFLDLRVAADSNVPELADKVQKATSSYVRDIVGVNVESVKVSVSDISLEGRR